MKRLGWILGFGACGVLGGGIAGYLLGFILMGGESGLHGGGPIIAMVMMLGVMIGLIVGIWVGANKK